MTTITCPQCQHKFEPTDAMRKEMEVRLREQMISWQKNKEEEFSKKEKNLQEQLDKQGQEYQQLLSAERKKLTEQISEQIRRSTAEDYEVQMKMMEESLKNNEEKLKTARQREIDFLRKEKELQEKEREIELAFEQKIREERQNLTEKIKREEAEKNAQKDNEHQLKLKELETKLEAQKKLAEEMKRRAEQGSMQLQGEAQELVLEEMLAAAFPYDKIEEVSKGKRGADCLLRIHNRFGQCCGSIIFESKRTNSFGADWIEKLKQDSRNANADLAVIVTQSMPRDMDRFGEKDGVWICGFHEVKAITHILRDGIMKIYQATKSGEGKGDKMEMLYDYLTGNEFAEQWNAIQEGFSSMKASIQKERTAMEKLWSAREKQIEKVLLNAARFKGSVEGIAGQDIDLGLDDGAEELLLD